MSAPIDPAAHVPATAVSAAAAASPGSVLRDLVAEGTLTVAQATVVAARLGIGPVAGPAGVAQAVAPPTRGGRLAEIAGYLGGALLLGAVVLFLTSGWSSLDTPGRVAVLAGLAIALLAAGWFVARSASLPLSELGQRPDSPQRRLVSVLWTFGAAGGGGAAGLASPDWQVLAGSAAGLLLCGAGYALVPAAVGQLGLWFGSIMLVTSLVTEIGDEPGGTAYAITLIALGAGWAFAGITGRLRERQVALAAGSVLALAAGQLPLIIGGGSTAAYLLTGAVAAAGYLGYLSTRSWPVLGVGVAATTLAVPEALNDWTDGSVSAAGTLLVAGLTLLTASALGLRLRREAH